jgi:hypothetical protein
VFYAAATLFTWRTFYRLPLIKVQSAKRIPSDLSDVSKKSGLYHQMSTNPTKIIGVEHQAFTFDETSLKQLGQYLIRIAIPALSVIIPRTEFIGPDFANNRPRLAELGIYLSRICGSGHLLSRPREDFGSPPPGC